MNTLHNVSCPSFPYTRLAIFTFLRKVHYIFTFFFFSRAVPANINEKVRKTVFFGLSFYSIPSSRNRLYNVGLLIFSIAAAAVLFPPHFAMTRSISVSLGARMLVFRLFSSGEGAS